MNNYMLIHGSFGSPFVNWFPYVKYDVEKEFADTIATKQIVIDDGGHLNSESGYTEFKELLEYL